MNVPLSVDVDMLLRRARVASRTLPGADRSVVLGQLAEALIEHGDSILAVNEREVTAERAKGTPQPLVDRLTLTEERLNDMAGAVSLIARLEDPLYRVHDGWRLRNGLHVRKVSVPFGVIGMIFESRPNVTVDAAALCLKAGSAAVLRGSSNALETNRALVRAIRSALKNSGVSEDAVQLIDSPDRDLVTRLLEARGQVDLVIPRGGASLIAHVVANAKVPVIETGVGNCHVYVDESADLEKAMSIIVNAKTQRPGVCNAAETLLVHRAVAGQFLPVACDALAQKGVEILGCATTRELVSGALPAGEEDWATEYLDLRLAVKVVDGIDEAIEHIGLYGTMHSEAIVTESLASAERFQREVDAAAVFVNASTRFTDGFVFGFGAEMGISTQKLHARGPMGLAEIVTFKYLVDGTGQVRE